jgi:hypothetical protein
MAIVMTINHGPNKGISYVDDSCVVKTQAEVDKILKNIGRIYYEDELEKYMKKIKEEQAI